MGYTGEFPLRVVHIPSGCGFGFCRQNPMLAIPVDVVVTSCISFVSVQARKSHSFRCSSSSQKSFDFSGTLFSPVRGLLRFCQKNRHPCCTRNRHRRYLFAVLPECRSCPRLRRRCLARIIARSYPSRSFSCGRRNFPSLIPTGRDQMHPF